VRFLFVFLSHPKENVGIVIIKEELFSFQIHLSSSLIITPKLYTLDIASFIEERKDNKKTTKKEQVLPKHLYIEGWYLLGCYAMLLM
jgi:hypothetical protein